MQRFFYRFFRDEEGATAIEYGLIAALISVVMILSGEFVGEEIDQTFDTIEDFLADANEGGDSTNAAPGTTPSPT